MLPRLMKTALLTQYGTVKNTPCLLREAGDFRFSAGRTTLRITYVGDDPRASRRDSSEHNASNTDCPEASPYITFAPLRMTLTVGAILPLWHFDRADARNP